MQSKILISADSTCDLSPELVEKYGIKIVPLGIQKDDKVYKDGIEMCADDIFRHVAASGKMCTTVAVNMADYYDSFAAGLEDHDAVIHFTISSKMSSCHQNACTAANELSNVYVIDAENLSTGIGQLVIAAAEMAQEGTAPAKIADAVNEMKKRLDVSFVINTLEYLRKGGRCSTLAALGANLLSLKPCIEVQNGEMHVGKKYRGSLSKCLSAYVKDRLADMSTIDTRRIFITDSGVSEDIYEQVLAAVKECGDFEEILHTRAGCTISNHCGPNCLGLLFFRK